MIRLPEFVNECLYQMNALAAHNSGYIVFEANRHERTPSRMHPETNRSLLHGSLRGRGKGETQSISLLWKRVGHSLALAHSLRRLTFHHFSNNFAGARSVIRQDIKFGASSLLIQ